MISKLDHYEIDVNWKYPVAIKCQ